MSVQTGGTAYVRTVLSGYKFYLWLEALKKSVTMDTLSAKDTVVCYHISRTLIGTGQYMTNVTPLKLSTVNENFMLLMM